jgi:hypothetical protein
MKMALPLLCLLVLHTPDGNEVAVDTRQILMVRTAEPIKHHLAHSAETVVFLSGYRVAVRELPHEVEHLVKTCEDGER